MVAGASPGWYRRYSPASCVFYARNLCELLSGSTAGGALFFRIGSLERRAGAFRCSRHTSGKKHEDDAQRTCSRFLTTTGVTFCLAAFIAAYVTVAHAEGIGTGDLGTFGGGTGIPALARSPNPSTSLTLLQSRENPVSPINPGTLPGITAGSRTSIGAPVIGFAVGSVYGLNNQLNSPTNPSAC